MTAELLCRLNAKAQNLSGLPPGFEGLSPHDLSHALTFVHGRGPRLLGRVRYAEQDEFLEPLAYQLSRALKHQAKAEKWRNQGPLHNLARLAVRLYARPQRCSKCHGVGQRIWGGKVITCPKCKDSKWESVSISAMARAVGVSAEAMEDTWHKRLGVALDILGGWDRRCIAGVQKAFDNPRNSG